MSSLNEPEKEIAVDGKTTPPPPAKDSGLTAAQDEDEPEYPSGLRLALVLGCAFVAVFLVALDRLIIATAIPAITNDFDSLNQVGWYAGAYLLTAASFQLVFGRIYTFYSVKWVFITSILIFEIGSAICGAAPNSVAFIIGRAIAGLGSGGIFSGSVIIITYVLPLHKRPMFQGLFGAVFGVSSVIGPLVGGAFTDNPHLTWRWCFYINLPIGGAAIVGILFFLSISQSPRDANLPPWEKFIRMDPIGNCLFIPSIVCLLLALQWGGSTYPWSDGRIIALIVLFGVLLIAFILVQFWRKDTATIPPRFFKDRNITGGFWFGFCVGSAFLLLVYYLPIWFQAVQGVDAVTSGLRLLPLVIALVITSIFTGIFISKVGYYAQFFWISPVFLAIGSGLISTFNIYTSSGKYIGYQIIFGIGMGMGMQSPNIAAQSILSRRDVATGMSIMLFATQIGGALFTSIGTNIFNNKLVENLTAAFPGLDAQTIVTTGATNLRNVVPSGQLDAVLVQYNAALTTTFYAAVAMSCLAILGAPCMKFVNVKKKSAQGASKKQSTAQDIEATAEAGLRAEAGPWGPAAEPEKAAVEPVETETNVRENSVTTAAESTEHETVGAGEKDFEKEKI